MDSRPSRMQHMSPASSPAKRPINEVPSPTPSIPLYYAAAWVSIPRAGAALYEQPRYSSYAWYASYTNTAPIFPIASSSNPRWRIDSPPIPTRGAISSSPVAITRSVAA